MTNTKYAEVELVICPDCAIWLANNDDSGMSDPEAHHAALADNWSGVEWWIAVGSEIEGWVIGGCEGCGNPDHGTGFYNAVATRLS